MVPRVAIESFHSSQSISLSFSAGEWLGREGGRA